MPSHGRKAKLQRIANRARGGPPAIAATLLLAAASAGCGTASHGSSSSASASSSSSSSELVARVGDTTIDRAELDHWAAAIGRGNSVATALGKMSGSPRQRALEFLISSSWVLGEAQQQGLSISSAAVEHGLKEKINAAPHGRPEFEEELASTGQTLADVKLEVSSSLAVARLRDAVAGRVATVTAAEVSGYYARHRRQFYLRDRRLVDLLEQIPGYAHAVALGKQLGSGARFAKRAIRELVHREPPAEAKDRRNGQLVQMIFAATPGRVAGPAIFNGRWVLAVVRKLIPAGIQPLSAVRGELSMTLAAQRRQRALKRFAAAFVRNWTARTSCSPGYVIQKCSQYRGALARGNPLTGG